MKKFVIVSTYPENGSKNIGDFLITESLQKVVSAQCDEDAHFDIVWRADKWDNVRKVCLNADHIFFACLAIRPNMKIVYPFLDNVIDSGVPFSAIAAGTDLRVQDGEDLYRGFMQADRQVLKRFDSAVKEFTTRGRLTQTFCESFGLRKARFAGDVAFYSPDSSNLSFEKGRSIRQIAVSSPHRQHLYMGSLDVLVDGLKGLFPDASIVLVEHGVGAGLGEFCKRKKIEIAKIYEDRNAGLNIYQDIDMHVGFRVHGHVSALKRRKYSYLLEQDGRGCDYGLTIDKKISVPIYHRSKRLAITPKNLARFVLGRPMVKRQELSLSPTIQLLSVIKGDLETGFEKFQGLDRQIESFNQATEHSVKTVLACAD